MATYAQLQSYFNTLLNRRTFTAQQTMDFIQHGVQRVQRELRVPAMEQVATITFDPTVPFTGITIPDNMLELIDILNMHGQRLVKEDISTVKQLMMWSPPGRPAIYYRMGGTWLIGPPPNVIDPNVYMQVVYYAELAPLVNPTDTNIISVIAPQLIVYAGLSYAADIFTDSRQGQWEAQYQKLKAELQNMADADELSGAAIVSPFLQWPSDAVGYGWTPGSVGE